MHFEFLVEDQSSGASMKILAPMLLKENATYRIHSYRGIGHIPKGLRPNSDAKGRTLLGQLPKLLRGYGKTPNSGYIIIICDLDDRDKKQFLAELHSILDNCNPKPQTIFCLSIEEFEAWHLGDLNAVRIAYPFAKISVLNHYINDSICGTWEILADAVYRGGHEALSKKGWQEVGKEKTNWAKAISPYMDIENNASPSFQFFRSQIQNIVAAST